MSFTTTHPISGEPLVIENPLTAEHIKVGAFIWYWGFTSVGKWDCPAVITRVNEKRRQFKVRSLDDMREQDQWYSFRCTTKSDSDRQMMRLTTPEEVKAYLETQRVRLVQSVDDTKARVVRAEAELARFDQFASTIIPAA